MDIQQHFNDTIHSFANDVYSTHPAVTRVHKASLFLSTCLSFKDVFWGAKDTNYTTLEIYYNHLPVELVDDLKLAMNNYFKPFMSKEDKIRHWLNVNNQRTALSSVSTVDRGVHRFTNLDLETAIRVFIKGVSRG
jgi:hypothetical protein